MSHVSNITDIPRQAGEKDLLSVDKYTTALETFITQAATPMTVAIQGPWGSGKTSMMNQIRANLCDNQKDYIPIWLNTWQYSLFCDKEETLLRIIRGLFDEVISVMGKDDPGVNETVAKTKRIFGGLARGIAKTGASLVGAGAVADEVIKEITAKDIAKDLTVNDLRAALTESINKHINSDKCTQKGFLIFIDDLDRIEPVIAVEILELLKNIFDIEQCLFILAIDYEVVVKGLEPKFGKPTPKNEREFRQFFDKIIQLPFNMPVHSYEIDGFLASSLLKINYFTDEEMQTGNNLALLTSMTSYSVGQNPRSMKRLTNTLSLIKIMNSLSEEVQEKNDELYEKQINYGLICLQLAYPQIYSRLNEFPDFPTWDEKVAVKMRLEPLDPEVSKRLDNDTYFDEPWEKVVFQCCTEDPFLESQVYNVSGLLNKIKECCPEKIKDEFGDKMQSLLSLTSVTEVDSAQSLMAGKKKHQRIVLDGIESFIEIKGKDGVNQDVLDLTKRFYDLIVTELKSHGLEVNGKFSTYISFRIEGFKRVFMWCHVRKKAIVFGGHYSSENYEILEEFRSKKDLKLRTEGQLQQFKNEIIDMALKSIEIVKRK